ncbi:uncharacterized protein [Macrobrachium rosenbergii]|uniref:uncharacterized protein n=1 Tax=Macrobrachium rosenbergii TaxID=79674 RepID=UPI0034D4418E
MFLISPSVQGLQRLIDTCRQYAEEFDILHNETKTQCMSLLPRPLKHIAEPQIFLGIHCLEFVHEFPYLGYTITDYLKDTADIEQRRRKLCATGNMIARRSAFCRRETKLLLFRSYCYSINGCSLWTYYTRESIRHITVHNDIMRRLTNTPRYHSATHMFTENRLDNLKITVRRTMSSLITRLRKQQFAYTKHPKQWGKKKI